jgi:radical SAM protein with 4Fe4S-binding SPASM domain
MSTIYFNLTDFCNQSCPFCFARKEMTHNSKKQINYSFYKKIAIDLKKLGDLTLDFLGGEPTLHTEFTKIVDFSMKHFLSIRLFTNGTFSLEAKKTLLKYTPRIFFVINISTPGFQYNKVIRNHVLKNVEAFAQKTPVILSVVSTFLDTSIINHFKHIPAYILNNCIIKLSFLSPEAGTKNPMKITDFFRVGDNLCKVIAQLEKIRSLKKIYFNYMFRPCMFTAKNRAFLKKRKLDFITKNTSCHEKEKTTTFHITSDLTTFKCYPLSTKNVFSIKNQSIKQTQKKYSRIEKQYEHKLILPECGKCQYFGFGKGKCSGPCLGFRINALNGKTNP